MLFMQHESESKAKLLPRDINYVGDVWARHLRFNGQRLCRRKNYGSQLARRTARKRNLYKNLGFSVSRATKRKPFTWICSARIFARIFARISARICCTNFFARMFARIFGTDFWVSQTTCWEAPKLHRESPLKNSGPSGEGLGRQEDEVETLGNRTKASLRGLERVGGHGHQWRKYRHSSGFEPWTEILSCVPSFSRGNFAENPLCTLDGWAIRNEDRGNSCESIHVHRFAETP